MFQPMRKKILVVIVCMAALFLASVKKAQAETVITGGVGQKYLLSAIAVNTSTHTLLKITFETTSPGDNLALCAGSIEDFVAGKCSTRLSDSGGPGFVFLTLVDAATLNGKVLFVLKEVGIRPGTFRFTIE